MVKILTMKNYIQKSLRDTTLNIYIYTFIAFNCITRLILFIFSLNNSCNPQSTTLSSLSLDLINQISSKHIVILLKSLFCGLLSDLVTFTFILPIILMILCIQPNKSLAKSIFFTIFTFFLVLLSYAEIAFFIELASRFNFIAVDYLVYTHEVWGHISQNYNIPMLIFSCFIISIAIGLLYYRKIQNNLKIFTCFDYRYVICSIFIPVCAYFIPINTLYKQSNHNAHIHVSFIDIAKNGLYELFSAFLNNSLDFEKFYVSKDAAVLFTKFNQTTVKFDNEISINQSPKSLSRDIINQKTKERLNHPNVVIIIVESLSAEYLKFFGNKENLTPNLDGLIKDSIVFSNMRAIGTRTVYGLQAILLSLPPVPGNSIVRRNDGEKLTNLGNIFQQYGYKTSFIYGGLAMFDNMGPFFSGSGYKVIDRLKLKQDEISFSTVWGACDGDVFNKALKEYDNLHSNNKKFFSVILTTSNHTPYQFPINEFKAPFTRKGAVAYTDYAIGKFINESKWKQWFNNTIFVIIADHTANAAGKLSLDPNKYHIPCIIYSPLFKSHVHDKLMSQIDLAPTLLGLIKMNYKSAFMGHDVFKSTYERAFISNYQNIGYQTPNHLLIFKTKKEIEFYKDITNLYLKDNKNNYLKNDKGQFITIENANLQPIYTLQKRFSHNAIDFFQKKYNKKPKLKEEITDKYVQNSDFLRYTDQEASNDLNLSNNAELFIELQYEALMYFQLASMWQTLCLQ